MLFARRGDLHALPGSCQALVGPGDSGRRPASARIWAWVAWAGHALMIHAKCDHLYELF